MVRMDLWSVTQPVGIIRTIAAILSCICFSLAASAGPNSTHYFVWCIFTWVFCFFFTFLILILEFTTFNTKLPFAWDDFTAAFAMLATLMCFAVSIIYPAFTSSFSPSQIAASVISWACCGVYAGEVVLTYFRPSGQSSGFLSTLPGIMKMLETFLACLIFASLEQGQFNSPELKWCVAVYSLCFIFAILIILLTLNGRLTSFFPFSLDYIVIVYNILAAMMYMTAMVMWPLYSFGTADPCIPCLVSKQVMITIMTIFNVIIYTLDSVYSIRLVFCVSRE